MNPGDAADDWSRSWPAPAKLNLFLHVVGRRGDGYHLLQTVFRFLDVGDRLRFSPRDDGRIVLATPLPGVADEQNLVVRAARALQKLPAGDRKVEKLGADAAANSVCGITIHLEKILPQGGGLGGGSSDAATTLLALNRLWGRNLDSAALQRIGLGLGADVPIFIHGHAAFAEGVGERFTDVTPPPAWYLVLVPPVAVPTATIFAASELVRDTPPIAAADWFSGFGRNDLEAVACARFPEIAAHLDWLRHWGDARLSGSGACCFAGFDTEASASKAYAALAQGMQGFIARGIDRHPLAMN